MKFVGCALVLGAVAAVPLSSPAVGPSSEAAKTLVEIVSTLEESGYGPVIDVSFDDGGWEVESYKGETCVELFIDSKTGKILSEHRDDAEAKPPTDGLKLSELLQVVEKAGYERIVEASFGRKAWEVEAYRDGVKRELRVDPTSGEIISDRADD